MIESAHRKLAVDAAEYVGALRKRLRARMDAMGLTEANGWVMVEKIVDRREGGARWIFAPMHATRSAPPTLECAVVIDSDGGVVPL